MLVRWLYAIRVSVQAAVNSDSWHEKSSLSVPSVVWQGSLLGASGAGRSIRSSVLALATLLLLVDSVLACLQLFHILQRHSPPHLQPGILQLLLLVRYLLADSEGVVCWELDLVQIHLLILTPVLAASLSCGRNLVGGQLVILDSVHILHHLAVERIIRLMALLRLNYKASVLQAVHRSSPCEALHNLEEGEQHYDAQPNLDWQRLAQDNVAVGSWAGWNNL